MQNHQLRIRRRATRHNLAPDSRETETELGSPDPERIASASQSAGITGVSHRARPVLRSPQIGDLGAVGTEKIQAPSQEQCRNQETSTRRNGGVWSLRVTPAGGAVKENIRYGATNGTVTKKPPSLRKKETFGRRETPYKCCDRKTAGSAQLAKEPTGTPGAATMTPALEDVGWRMGHTEREGKRFVQTN
nr:uncharacterized protein LOC130541574 [Pan paniscus]